MAANPFMRKLALLASALMIIGGVGLTLWLLENRPNAAPGRASAAGDGTSQVEATPTPVILDPLVMALAEGMPVGLQRVISETMAVQPGLRLAPSAATSYTLALDWQAEDGTPLYTQTFAAAAPFNTIFPTTTYTAVQAAWAGEVGDFTGVAVLTTTLPALTQILGEPGETVAGYGTVEEVASAVYTGEGLLALVPFDQLVPKLAVLAIDGQNPVENSNRFDPAAYPLVATLYLHRQQPVSAEEAPIEAALLAAIPPGNRNPDQLTVLTMTGVTAMCRFTAKQMDELGYDWPAEVVGPELAAADITHISNEVPFVEGCETDTSSDNFNFCSKPDYMATLVASGADIIGLTGNHQNDYGRDNALKSLDIYEKAGLPVYGGGRNAEAANTPFFLEHNGNRLAFLGANSYGPALAWAGEDEPGSARLDVDRLAATIRSIREQDQADLIFVELQYQETYDVNPLIEQRVDFNALIEAGADVVTGVQSHVPQALEFTEGKLILYGLGNLYFDQMWTQPTREGLVVKHTLYEGRHISTQLLTTLIYDYGQPRWTSPDERETLLRRVFAASYWEN
jgi:hypothetical protein